MLYFAYFTVTAIESRHFCYRVYFSRLKSHSHFKYLVSEGIHEQFVFLLLQSLLQMGLFIDGSEKLVMWFDFCMSD